MTSKEALETLVYGLCNRNYTKEDLGITMSRCREIIAKDLDLLDTIKPLLKSMYDMAKNYNEDRFITLYCNNEMKNKIKDWLK